MSCQSLDGSRKVSPFFVELVLVPLISYFVQFVKLMKKSLESDAARIIHGFCEYFVSALTFLHELLSQVGRKTIATLCVICLELFFGTILIWLPVSNSHMRRWRRSTLPGYSITIGFHPRLVSTRSIQSTTFWTTCTNIWISFPAATGIVLHRCCTCSSGVSPALWTTR